MTCKMFWNFYTHPPRASQESTNSLKSFPNVAYFQVQVRNSEYCGGEATELCIEEGIAASSD